MLIDAAGYRHVTVTETPRIVSLVPSLTELLFALDLRDNIVGRTNFCIEPADQVASVPVVGGTKTFDVEEIFALRPTHVLVNIDETPKELANQIQINNISIQQRNKHTHTHTRKFDVIRGCGAPSFTTLLHDELMIY